MSSFLILSFGLAIFMVSLTIFINIVRGFILAGVIISFFIYLTAPSDFKYKMDAYSSNIIRAISGKEYKNDLNRLIINMETEFKEIF